MNLPPKVFLGFFFGAICVGPAQAASSTGRVTQIIRDVDLLPTQAGARPAEMNDLVNEDTGLRTGNQSRSELTFSDLTITRLGANSVFTFNRAGRNVRIDSGSILLRVPPNSGGANMRARTVSVAVTGTTLILEAARNGRSRLLVLEGGARCSLVQYPSQRRDVRAGQLLDVPAGATTLPEPVNFDVDQVMRTHPLIVGFAPLPSRDRIANAGRNPAPSGGGAGPSIGIGLPGIFGGGPGNQRAPGLGTNPNTTGRRTQGQTRRRPSNPNSPTGP